MKFYDEEHENFYNEKLKLLSVKDPYRESLFYVLGLMEDTRKHFNRIYDTKEKAIIPEVLDEPWQTGGTLAIVRLGFNLYNGYVGNEKYKKDDEEATEKASYYAVDEIFQYREFAEYFYEAIKIRFEMI